MNKHLSSLIALQNMDAEAGKLKKQKNDLPLRLKQLDEANERYNLEFEENKKRYDDVLAQHKELESRLKKGSDSLSKAKDRLGEVKTNKEYQAILKEIESIETKNSEVETEIICLLEEIDTRKGIFQEKEKAKEQHNRQYEVERQNIAREIDSLDEKILMCSQELKKILESIPKDLTKRYDMIKAVNHGTAVVSVWKGVCGGCFMNIPPQLYNELQKTDDLISCPNCSRIIYWQNKE
ncbi:MAG: putative zinc ribbon domain protein [Syntrophus sp. PtaU1.Bin005]|uniref:zinc ribbon domain-containing protein n=1 Tax=Syntrophus buswellii TaxID=43774 RepID=UPI0009CBD0F8|nr:MAG: putative zinc ribbon domain protein [Syntrophus sp. PtaU1.Bin005]